MNPSPLSSAAAAAAAPTIQDALSLDALSLESRANATEKETVNVVFIGHVDAGKSTLGGNILVLTGNVDARTLEKYQQESKELNRESWYLSWALDTSQEERSKGITVEVGRAVSKIKLN